MTITLGIQGHGSGRLQSVRIEVRDDYANVSVRNCVVYSEFYGVGTDTDFETVWAKIGEKLKHYGEE